jgi:hypothetical protein
MASSKWLDNALTSWLRRSWPWTFNLPYWEIFAGTALHSFTKSICKLYAYSHCV